MKDCWRWQLTAKLQKSFSDGETMIAFSTLVAAGRATYILILAPLITFLAFFFVFLPMTKVNVPRVTICGDGACQGGETCLSCPQDCRCGEGEACYSDNGKCGSIPADVDGLLEKAYGTGGYGVTSSWTEDGKRVFYAEARGVQVLIKDGTIKELEPL